LLDVFNRLPPEQAEKELSAVCASPVWVAAVVAGLPYEDLDALLRTSAAAFDRLSWDQVAAAVDAHPRIGQRPAGDGQEAAWSRREQGGVHGAADELAEANRAYEERFGFVFLVFASGKSAEQILDAARQRLGNDDETERRCVRVELGKIVRLRLERLVAAA
jgi:2-oxo-4-hydroxy-4-carboxy-5-ureidoimidazoline decarboxylase